MTDTSHVDYVASYNYDPRSSRTIQSVPVLPGQQRPQPGRYGLATSRFFSRRSLLGSSATELPPPAWTRQPEALPETHRPSGVRRSSSSRRSRIAQHGMHRCHTWRRIWLILLPAAVLPTTEHAGPPPASLSRSRHIQHRQRQSTSASAVCPPVRDGAPSSSGHHQRPASVQPSRLPSPAQYPEIQRLRDKIARWQDKLEPPRIDAFPSADPANEENRRLQARVDTASSLNEYDYESNRRCEVRKVDVLPKGVKPPTASSPEIIQVTPRSSHRGSRESTDHTTPRSFSGNASATFRSGSSGNDRPKHLQLEQARHSGTLRRPVEAIAEAQKPELNAQDRPYVQGRPPNAPPAHPARSYQPASENLPKGHYTWDGYTVDSSGAPIQPFTSHTPSPQVKMPPQAHTVSAYDPGPDWRLERVTTTYYGEDTPPAAPPTSAKPSFASLPRLSTSAQVPLVQGLRAYVSDEESSASERTYSKGRNTSAYPASIAASTAAVGGRGPLPDVPEQWESGPSANGKEQEPVRKIKTKYGNTYTRYDDPLPFEAAHFRPAPVSAAQFARQPPTPEFRGQILERPQYSEIYEKPYPAPHTSAQAETPQQPYQSKRPPPQRSEEARYSFHERSDEVSKRFAQELAEARQEMRSIFSENNVVRSPSPLGNADRHTHQIPDQRVDLHGSALASVRHAVTKDDSSRVRQSRKQSKPAAVASGREQSPTMLPKPKRPVEVASTEASDDDGDEKAAKAMKKRMAFKKPPTPFTKPIDSISGEDSAPVSSAEQPDEGEDAYKMHALRTKKKKRRRSLVSALKKPAVPTPGQTPTISDARKSVHFGGATPADVGGNFSPPPHSSQETPSTVVGQDEEASREEVPFGPIIRSREPSPDPAEYERYHAKSKKGKDSAEQHQVKDDDKVVFRDLSNVTPRKFDFSQFSGPTTAALDFNAEIQPRQPAEAAANAPALDFTASSRRPGAYQTRESNDDNDEEDSFPKLLQPRTRTPRQKLQLMAIPTVEDVYRKLPAVYLANGVLACKGLSVYTRLRELVWDYSCDLEVS